MDVSLAQSRPQAAAAASANQSHEASLVQKVLRNPNASDADIKAANLAARDGDADDAAQQAALAAVVGKGSTINTRA